MKRFTIIAFLSLIFNISFSQNIKDFLEIHNEEDFLISEYLNKMIVTEKDTIRFDEFEYPVIIKTHITFMRGDCPSFKRFYNFGKNISFNRETYIERIEPIMRSDYESYRKRFDKVRSNYTCE
jgi:uncharacterized protein YqhQ